MSRKRDGGDRPPGGDDLDTLDPELLRASLAETSDLPPPRSRGRDQEGSLALVHGRWVYRWRDPPDESGKRRRRAQTVGTLDDFATRTTAQKEVDRRKARLLRPAGGSSPTFAAICALYRARELPEKHESTQRTYALTIERHLLPAFGTRRVHEITSTCINAWMRAELKAHQQGKRRAAHKTRVAHRECLLAVLKFAEQAGFDAHAPTRVLVKVPSAHEPATTIEDLAYTPSELEAIAAACPDPADPYGAIYAVLTGTGIRGGECLALEWANIELERTPRIKVRANVGRSGQRAATKSKAGVRDVPMRGDLVARVRAYQLACGRPVTGLVFPGAEQNKPLSPSTLSKHFNRLMRALGFKRTGRSLHGFRHAYALAHADAGTPPALICKLLGWSSFASAAAYLTTSRVSSTEAVDSALGAREQRSEPDLAHESIGVRFNKSRVSVASRVQPPKKSGNVIPLPKRPKEPE